MCSLGLKKIFINVIFCRVESDFYERKENDKMWLVRHLEILRKYCVEDLRVAKFQCVPVFPPAYNIFEQYVHWYHLALSNHVSEP